MRLRSAVRFAVQTLVLLCALPAFAAVPTVNSFTVAKTCVSPVPVTAFTAADSDGTVVGYLITATSARPSASDSRWTSTPWSSFGTSSVGNITLYAWAKDNANGVSSSRSAQTTVVAAHNHDAAYVNEGQADSITTPMIVDGAVTAGKLGIVCADGQYLQFTAAGGWACGAGAAGSTPRLANVVVVAKDGWDFTDPIAAVNSIADASAANPYLVKVMPGTYDLGDQTLVMKEGVDLEGSGANVTRIVGTAASGVLVQGALNVGISRLALEMNANSGVVVQGPLGRLTEARVVALATDVASLVGVKVGDENGPSLTIENTEVSITAPAAATTGLGVVGIHYAKNQTAGSMKMSHVSVTVVAGSANCTAMRLDRGHAEFRGSSFYSTERAILAYVGGYNFFDCSILGDLYGMTGWGAGVVLFNCYIRAATALYSMSGGFYTVVNTHVGGEITPGSYKFTNCTNVSFDPLVYP